MDNNELQHHGIIGMKWGVRHYQNKDGSLTAAGKRRASTDKANARAKKIVSDAKVEAKKIAVRTKNKAIVDNAKKEAEAIKAKARGESGDSKSKGKPVSEMSLDELKKAIERKRLEKEYTSLTPEKQSLMKTIGNDVLKPAAIASGKAAATALFTKWAKEALGLDDNGKKAAKEVADTVKKEVDNASGEKKKKNTNNDDSNKPEDSKSNKSDNSGIKGFMEFVARGGKTPEEYARSQERKNKKSDDVEIVEPSKDAWRDKVKSKGSNVKPSDPEAAPYKEIGKSTLDKYLTELTGDDFWGE